MTRSEIIDAINIFAARLEGPLSDTDRDDGWTDSSRSDVLQYFKNVQKDLKTGVEISFFSLVRALDGMGITKGDLLEEACRINNAVNELTD